MQRRHPSQRNKREARAREGGARKAQRKRAPSKNSFARTNKRSNRAASGIQTGQTKSIRNTKKKIVRIPTSEGTRTVTIRVSPSSRQASTLGKYWNAVHHYLQTGDASRLKKFTGKYITDVKRVRFPLLTDTDALDRLGSAGVLSFESLYARSA